MGREGAQNSAELMGGSMRWKSSYLIASGFLRRGQGFLLRVKEEQPGGLRVEDRKCLKSAVAQSGTVKW